MEPSMECLSTNTNILETEDRPEHYSYEAETDYLEWEALTRKKRLEDLHDRLP